MVAGLLLMPTALFGFTKLNNSKVRRLILRKRDRFPGESWRGNKHYCLTSTPRYGIMCKLERIKKMGAPSRIQRVYMKVTSGRVKYIPPGEYNIRILSSFIRNGSIVFEGRIIEDINNEKEEVANGRNKANRSNERSKGKVAD